MLPLTRNDTLDVTGDWRGYRRDRRSGALEGTQNKIGRTCGYLSAT
jgi:hypothetical protein